MIEHVFRRAVMCDCLDAVYVATCDEEIRAVVEGFGGAALITSAAHQRASDRVAEAAERLQADSVVMKTSSARTVNRVRILSLRGNE